jgi:hypothetical protein
MEPLSEVIQLAKEAEARIDQTFNAPDVLPFATKALEIIASHPELREAFELEFMDMHSYAPKEFVQICIHALMWPKMKVEFETRHRDAVARNDWRSEPVYRHYLEAFDVDWEDASDFYGDYFRR